MEDRYRSRHSLQMHEWKVYFSIGIYSCPMDLMDSIRKTFYPLIQHEGNFSISKSLTNKCTFPSKSIRVPWILPPWPPPGNNIKSEERDRANKAVILACGQALLFWRAKGVLRERTSERLPRGAEPPPPPTTPHLLPRAFSRDSLRTPK